tara:strand:+ start:120 stop:233 length:114 start_codon:yes stop_codon:yes gene_type:complete
MILPEEDKQNGTMTEFIEKYKSIIIIGIAFFILKGVK